MRDRPQRHAWKRLKGAVSFTTGKRFERLEETFAPRQGLDPQLGQRREPGGVGKKGPRGRQGNLRRPGLAPGPLGFPCGPPGHAPSTRVRVSGRRHPLVSEQLPKVAGSPCSPNGLHPSPHPPSCLEDIWQHVETFLLSHLGVLDGGQRCC